MQKPEEVMVDAYKMHSAGPVRKAGVWLMFLLQAEIINQKQTQLVHQHC